MKIIGQLVCGPNEANKYLIETLDEFKRLCDDVIVCLCNAGIKEEALLRKYQFRYYKDDREWGRYQPDIKTDLLKRIVQLEPDWILVLDADETVPTVDRKILEGLSRRSESCQFYVVNLWNDLQHYRRDLCFYNVRFYKNRSGMETQFLRRRLHCGNAPPYFYSLPSKETYVPHLLVHKGLMEKENRVQKVERYQTYDPKAECKGQEYYDALSQDWATGTEYVEAEVVNKISNFINNLK